jgi:hypothetical protein
MRPIFSPTEYIQIKGRGTRLFTFKIGHTEYKKEMFFLLDFCAVAEYFEEKYDYSAPLKLPRYSEEAEKMTTKGGVGSEVGEGEGGTGTGGLKPPHEIPVWQGIDTLVSQEVRMVGPDGEKVDIMTFRGGYERDIKLFVEKTPELQDAIEEEDDDAIETIVTEQFYHKPKAFYSPDKLVIGYGVPATTPAFVYNAVGKKPLPTKDEVVSDTVDSIAARFNLRYAEQKWVNATAQLLADDTTALNQFLKGDMTIFTATQFNQLGGIEALSRFENRESVFEALRQSSLIRQTMLAA